MTDDAIRTEALIREKLREAEATLPLQNTRTINEVTLYNLNVMRKAAVSLFGESSALVHEIELIRRKAYWTCPAFVEG